MKFDVFFSICQTPVDGYMPNEAVMLRNFFDQVATADELGYGCAWVAETHLSCQIQKRNPGAVIPHFEGEIGLNTDILQLAHIVFSKTKNIHVGSAIRNIMCNGGPIAHAEAVRTFLSYHSLGLNQTSSLRSLNQSTETRRLELGFAAGRFPFSNIPYGVRPRNEIETRAWPALRGLVFLEATEIFLRFLRGDVFSSRDVTPKVLRREHFRSDQDWEHVCKAFQTEHGGYAPSEIEVPAFWNFDQVGVIPFEAPLDNLRLTIGAHDAVSQALANRFLPVGVFNLSITPANQIEETHQRMLKTFHASGGQWTRAHMPRTALVFLNNEKGLSQEARRQKAKTEAEKALSNYWKAIEGTLDPAKISGAVDNALVGSPEDIVAQMKARFHPDDRLMLWFDFNNHNSEAVQLSMRAFMEEVAPHV